VPSAARPNRKAITSRSFALPHWWLGIAPGKPSSFWVRVERERAESNVDRHDYSSMTYIINRLKGVRHVRFR
jgi:hypothetical protein